MTTGWIEAYGTCCAIVGFLVGVLVEKATARLREKAQMKTREKIT